MGSVIHVVEIAWLSFSDGRTKKFTDRLTCGNTGSVGVNGTDRAPAKRRASSRWSKEGIASAPPRGLAMESGNSRSRRRRGPGGPASYPASVPASPSFLFSPGFDSTFQGGLQPENQNLWGSSRPKGQETSGEELEDAPRNGGAQQYLPPFSPSYGGNSPLFSSLNLFSPQPPVQQQQQSSFISGFNWQGFLSGQQNLLAPQTFSQGISFGNDQGITPTTSQAEYGAPESSWPRGRVGDGHGASNLSLGEESSESQELTKGDRSNVWREGKNCGEKRRESRGSRKEDVKTEVLKEVRTDKFKEAFYPPKYGSKAGKKKHRRKKPRESCSTLETGNLEDSMDFELSVSSSESGSSSDSYKEKREAVKKRKKAGQDADGNVTWTDESVRFLFETYDAIHQRLWEESNGQVKYQKKWTPILKAMQDRFGKHFSKKQCQSKYWSVRRECTDYRYMSAKAARSDPSWNPSIAGRELLKPKFYDVWFEVSGKNQAVLAKTDPTPTFTGKEGLLGEITKRPGHSDAWRLVGQPIKHKVKDCGSAMKEMQRLMQIQLQASEKREEAMKYRAELMMELLTQHMEHVEKRVSTLEDSRQPQLYLLERVNYKLEKVLEGFTALNDNLSTIAYRITKSIDT